ncbi:tape measure protein [Oscillospiraceae bacterium OttesenSCG-928-G22]|nr:tape measure protein [Oscillospiraceae bacterium OttesenSCG-928-G22]
MAYDGTLKFDTAMDAKGFQKGVDTMGNIVKGMTAFKLLEKGFEAVVSSMDKAVSRYDTLNRFPRVLENMGYSAEASATSTQKLADGVQGLPTSLDEIVSSAQRLTILTGNLEMATDTALALNNAFYASGATAADASRGLTQYVQMLSSGKVDMVSWRTLQETMGYALNKTAEAFGFVGASAQNDLYAALRDGVITFTEFNAKIVGLNAGIGGFAEMAKTSTGGIATAFTNMRTRIAAGMTEVIAAIDRGLSETKFKSIENIISSTGTAIKTVLTSVAGAFEFVAKNIEPLTIGVIAFAAAWKGVQLLSYVGQLGSLTAALGAMTPALLKAVAAKIADQNTTLALTAAYAAETVAKGANAVATKLTTAADGGSVVAKIALAAATHVAAAATWVFNAALAANPIGLVIAGVAALVVGIIALVAWLSSSSEEYKKQKEEVKALADAQDELAESMQSREDAFNASTDSMEANAKVAQNLVGKLKDISSSSDSAEDKHRRMANTVKQLNATVDGLNIAYDKETGAITNLNTGQEISIDQLEELISAKAELAQANAWAERANELVAEQVRLLEEQEVILNKIDEINENEALSQREKDKLIKDLTATYDEYGVMVEDVQNRIDIANEKVESSDTSMAESIVASHERIGQAVTSSGESIEEVAAQWGVSVDEILAAMERENISLDEWVTKQQDAWADYEESVKERTQGVINSFKEIPGEYDKSAAEMLEILQNNKERYAEWEATMEEITRQLGPTAAEEFGKLGPEATSAMQEILGSAEMLDEYREVFGVKLDEVTGLAVEDWNDPNFIGAPAGAIDTSAQLVTENTALETAVTGQMEGAKAAAEAVDFTDVGQSIATEIVNGLNGADVSGAMGNITTAITNNTGKVVSAATSMSTQVQNVFKTMSTQSQSTVTQMMTQINSAIVSRASTVKASATNMGNGVTQAMDTMKTQAANITNQMMTNINSAIVTHTSTVKSSATALSNGVVSALEAMVKGAENVTVRMMDGMLSAMNRKAQELYAKAREIADRIAATMAAALDVHSPSRVMIRLFTNVMMGIYKGMEGMEGMLYREAGSIADGIAERLTVSPDVLRDMVAQMRAVTDTAQLGGTTLVPQPAGAGIGGVNYSTNLTQNITTPKPLSASEMTREGQDLLRRQRWQLP